MYPVHLKEYLEEKNGFFAKKISFFLRDDPFSEIYSILTDRLLHETNVSSSNWIILKLSLDYIIIVRETIYFLNFLLLLFIDFDESN